MAHKVGIYYNESGMRQIMKGPEIANLEQQIMMQKLNLVQAEFLQHFGFAGRFEVKSYITSGGRGGRSRVAYKNSAADGRTTAALKKEPGWIAKFTR